jgi:hypothetical protein
MRLHTKENATGSPAHDRLVPLPYWFRNLFLPCKTHADDIDVAVVSQYADWKRNFLVSYRLTNYKPNFFLSFYVTTTQPYSSSSTVVVVVYYCTVRDTPKIYPLAIYLWLFSTHRHTIAQWNSKLSLLISIDFDSNYMEGRVPLRLSRCVCVCVCST